MTDTHPSPLLPARRVSARFRVGRLCALLAALVAALLATAPAAWGARDYRVELMDDQLLLGKSNTAVRDSLRQIRGLGVDQLRISAFWRDIAPNPRSRVRPNFDATDPRAPEYRWTDLDRVIATARAEGLEVLVSISGPIPIWASEQPSKRNPVWKPDPGAFADFSQAITERYASRVEQWAIYNEPNVKGWLQPQSVCKGDSTSLAGCEPFAPHQYRRMARAAYPRIKAADPSSIVLIGELASSGSSKLGPERGLRPLLFLREMGCKTGRGLAPLRRSGCQNFTPVTGDAMGHHPYGLFLEPNEKSSVRDDATLGDTKRFLRFLDKLQRKGGIRPSGGGRFKAFYTEYGYQTDPPDPFAGIPLARQSRFLQDAAYLVWRNPRVESLNQFRLSDGKVGRGLEGFQEFQSGLLFANHRPKPSYLSFPHPISAKKKRVRRGKKVKLWGQVRRGGAHRVRVLRKKGKKWKSVGTKTTDAFGSFVFKVKVKKTTQFRYRYSGPSASGTSSPLKIRVRRR